MNSSTLYVHQVELDSLGHIFHLTVGSHTLKKSDLDNLCASSYRRIQDVKSIIFFNIRFFILLTMFFSTQFKLYKKKTRCAYKTETAHQYNQTTRLHKNQCIVCVLQHILYVCELVVVRMPFKCFKWFNLNHSQTLGQKYENRFVNQYLEFSFFFSQ